MKHGESADGGTASGGAANEQTADAGVVVDVPAAEVEGGGVPSPPPSALRVFGDRVDQAERYCEILASDGIDHGLIGPRELPRLWDRHIVNCGVVGEILDEGVTVVDIGSGAGLPGIPLALARSDLSITLVEPLLRRSDFLERVIDSLGLTNVRVVRGRAEERSVLDAVEPADVVTSRAVAPLERLARWSAPLIRDGGRLVAIKGSSVADEIARDAGAAGKVGIRELTVFRCGDGWLDPPTTVAVGTKVGSPRSRAAAKGKKKRR